MNFDFNVSRVDRICIKYKYMYFSHNKKENKGISATSKLEMDLSAFKKGVHGATKVFCAV